MILALLWVSCAIAAFLYTRIYNIPAATALAVFPAFLLEATFFYALALETVRARLEKLPRVGLAWGLTVAAVAPYLVASLALGSFQWRSLFWIAALGAAASFWYVVLPHKPVSDLLFLLFMAVVWLSRIFHGLYVSPHPKVPLDALGQLMWFRTGIFAMISVRRIKGVGFGFWPKAREWRIGAAYYVLFVPVAAVLAWWIGFARFKAPLLGWERTSFLTIVTFFGVLWVLALAEEFFFRGLLQQWMTAWLHSEWGGLVLTSLLFGSAHLWYRAFPNWRFAAMAGAAGAFYGLAFRQASSIRASMVTHALVVTTWRIFFSG